MPIYAYRCEHCGHAKDVLQKVSDPVLTVCPACGQPTFRKQVTAAGFQLKGSGWYVTDFRDNQKPAGKADDAKAGDGKAGESKPADAPATNGSSADAKPEGGSAAKTEAAPAAAPSPAPAAAPPSSPGSARQG